MSKNELKTKGLHHKWGNEYFVTAHDVGALESYLSKMEAQPLLAQVIGWTDTSSPMTNCPTTSLSWPTPKPGLTVWALEGVELKHIKFGDRLIGVSFEDENATYLRVGGVTPSPRLTPGKKAAEEVFSILCQALSEAGMDFSHVIRTWFFNDDILSWYDDFNAVRTAFFHEAGVFDCLVPASTGIGAANAFGAAMMTGLLAVKAKNNQTSARRVPSPLQCSPRDYGSSFNRAVALRTPKTERLFISGTASVAPEGHTAHIGDLEKQIELTFEVVEAILAQCDMNWSHVSRSIAYLKTIEFNDEFNSFLVKKELGQMPLLTTVGTICRDDLLFEIELDAIKEL